MPLIFNIGKVILNLDMIPWFGYVGQTMPEKLIKNFSSLPSTNFGNITVYDNWDSFIPVLHFPEHLLIVDN